MTFSPGLLFCEASACLTTGKFPFSQDLGRVGACAGWHRQDRTQEGSEGTGRAPARMTASPTSVSKIPHLCPTGEVWGAKCSSPKHFVFLSSGCSNKAPKTGCLKTSEIHYLILEAKIAVLQGPALSDKVRGESLPVSANFQCLPATMAPLGLSLCHPIHVAVSSLCVFTPSSCTCQSLCPNCPFLWEHQSYWIRAHSNYLSLIWLSLERPCIQIRSHSEVLRVRTSSFGGM